MREGIGKWARGLFAAGSLAAASGEAAANPYYELSEQREQKEEGDLAWAQEARVQFDAARAASDVAAMADVARAFVQEYRHPTRGKIRQSAQNNPARVLPASEWHEVRDVATHMLAHASGWGKEYPGLERLVTDVVVRIDDHLDEPGPANAHRMPTGPQGEIDRSLGYK